MITSHQTRLLIGTLLVASTLTILVDTAISPALPAIERHFAGVANAAFWVRVLLVFPSLFVALGAPLMGVFTDRLGRKPVLFVSTALYGVAGGAGFIIESLILLFVSRALLGIGAAGVFVAVTTLITDYFPAEQRRDAVLGWQGASMTFGGAAFFLFGGALASVGWRVPFLLYLGALGLLPCIVAVVYEPDVDHEASQADASIRQVLDRLPYGQLALVYSTAVIGMVVFFMVPVEIPFYLTAVVNADDFTIAVVLATQALLAAVVSTQYTRVRSRIGIIPIVGLLFALMGVGFSIVSLGDTVVAVLVGTLVTGAGVGLLIPNLNAWVAIAVPAGVRGRAVGGLTSFLFLGQFLSPFVSSPISTWLSLRMTFRIGGGLLVGLSIVIGVLAWYGGGLIQSGSTTTP
ncbi:MFS transporter [Halocatena halophila]|uniref:MFS transporter n=1 Tax=Halocatena halophila TaxID=2814576 RepID=UPI002ED25BE4